MKPSFKTAFATAAIALGAIVLSACCDNKTADTAAKDATMNELKLTAEWDKVFPQSDKVNGKWAAIAVSGPYGAVKEQVSGRYAQAMEDRATSLRRISISKTLAPRWIIFRFAMTWTPNASA